MKTIYLDCGMGAAGDMLTAALIELLPDPDDMVKRLNELPLPGIVFKRERILRSGITGTHMRVFIHGDEEGSETAHEHSHRHNHTAPGDIEKLIRSLPVSDKVKDDATAVYDLLAQAESRRIPYMPLLCMLEAVMSAVRMACFLCRLRQPPSF